MVVYTVLCAVPHRQGPIGTRGRVLCCPEELDWQCSGYPTGAWQEALFTQKAFQQAPGFPPQLFQWPAWPALVA